MIADIVPLDKKLEMVKDDVTIVASLMNYPMNPEYVDKLLLITGPNSYLIQIDLLVTSTTHRDRDMFWYLLQKGVYKGVIYEHITESSYEDFLGLVWIYLRKTNGRHESANNMINNAITGKLELVIEYLNKRKGFSFDEIFTFFGAYYDVFDTEIGIKILNDFANAGAGVFFFNKYELQTLYPGILEWLENSLVEDI